MSHDAYEIECLLQNTLTVEDLMEELKCQNPKARVVFSCDYGDRGHTKQALSVATVEELSEDEYLEESAYSNSRVAIEDRDSWHDEDEADEDREERTHYDVVVLRS